MIFLPRNWVAFLDSSICPHHASGCGERTSLVRDVIRVITAFRSQVGVSQDGLCQGTRTSEWWISNFSMHNIHVQGELVQHVAT